MLNETPSDTAIGPPLRGLSLWAERYDLLLCDVWGVVHDGVAALPPACDALSRFRAGGGTVVLITNAPRPRGSIVELLDRLGVPHEAYDAIVSSGDVTVDQIVARGAAPLHHLGPARDDPLFEEAARRGAAPSRVTVADATYVVCTGLYRDRDEPESYDPLLAQMKASDLTFVCANPDIVVHAGESIYWCAGAVAERYAALGGRVVSIGKPHPLIYEAARDEARRVRGTAVPAARILAIGDGMFTDIRGAAGQGFDALFITSGVHRDRVRLDGPDGGFVIEPAAYGALAVEAGLMPTGYMHALAW